MFTQVSWYQLHTHTKGQRASVKGHHSGDEICQSQGQYETKAEFREDVISTVSSSPSLSKN